MEPLRNEEVLLAEAYACEARIARMRAGWAAPAATELASPASTPGDVLLRKRIALNTL